MINNLINCDFIDLKPISLGIDMSYMSSVVAAEESMLYILFLNVQSMGCVFKYMEVEEAVNVLSSFIKFTPVIGHWMSITGMSLVMIHEIMKLSSINVLFTNFYFHLILPSQVLMYENEFCEEKKRLELDKNNYETLSNDFLS